MFFTRYIKNVLKNNKRISHYLLLDSPTIKIGQDHFMTNETIKNLLSDSKPHFIGRMGWGGEPTPLVFQLRKERMIFLKYPKDAKKALSVNAGMFSTDFFGRHFFLKKSIEAIRLCDYIGLWDDSYSDDKKIVERYSKLQNSHFLSAEAFDCLTINSIQEPYYKSLGGKRVLIINPNAELIKSQYLLKDKIFPPSMQLPDFSLITYKPINTQGINAKAKYRNWKKCLEKMVDDVSHLQFDIALVSCGSYGMPLCAEIFKMNKTVVYVGGALQLFFGIIGKRWENKPIIKQYINSYWKRPSADTKPEGFCLVEDGCYW